MKNCKIKPDGAFAGAAFAFFLMIACYKLTNASLWVDETVEYWYSKILFGTLPFDGAGTAAGSTNMYQRIISTFQPPLYNMIMFFWLKISDSQWWFRFFGVVMGFIGMLGIYRSMRQLSIGNIVASSAVVFSSCVFRVLYYWQECSEYCLMLGSLCWTIYFWIVLMQEINRKNIICFTISAIIPVYSQYGAAFPIAIMILTSIINILLKKEKHHLKEVITIYAGAFFVAAVPLYVFFLKEQLRNQHGGVLRFKEIAFKGGIIKGTFSDLFTVFKWNLAPYYGDESVWLLLLTVLVIFSIVAVRGENIYRWIVTTNVLTWIIYDIAVRIGVYSFGILGNRYNMFFLPLWIISGFVVFVEFLRILRKNSFLAKREIHIIAAGALECFIFCFCILGWNAKIQDNWTKEDIRGVVKTWYNENAAEKHTLVYYTADSGFAYYVRTNKTYEEQTERNVIYMPWYRNRSGEEYREYISGVYGKLWPQEIYMAVSHAGSDLDILLQQFIDNGYVRQNVFNSGGGLLIKLIKQ